MIVAIFIRGQRVTLGNEKRAVVCCKSYAELAAVEYPHKTANYGMHLHYALTNQLRWQARRGGKLVSTMTILREFLWRRFCRKYSIDDRKGLTDGTTSNEFSRTFQVSQAVIMLQLRNLSPHSEELSSVASILKIVSRYIVWLLVKKYATRIRS